MSIAVVASAFIDQTSTSSAINTTGADALVVFVARYSTAPTLTDSKGNTFTGHTEANFVGDFYGRFFICLNPTVGTGHTFSLAGTAGANNGLVIALSGVKQTSPIDGQVGGGFVTSSPVATGSLTPSENDCILIACGANYNVDGDYTAIDSGFTLLLHGAGDYGNHGYGLAYKIQTTAGAENANWTVATPSLAGSLMIALKSVPPPDTTAPSQVGGTPTATPASSTQINLDWADATDNVAVTDYLLERATDAGFTTDVVSGDIGSSTSSKNVTGLTPEGTYYWRVKAKDAAGNYSASWSATFSATTWATGPTITETSPLQTAELGVAYSNAIAFSDGDGAVTISVESGYSLPSGFSISGNAVVNSNPTSLVAGATFRLKATDSKGQTHTKDFTFSVTDTVVPTQVSGVEATVISTSQIDVDSDGSTDTGGIASYDTRIADDAGMSINVHSYNHAATAYSITANLSPTANKTYYIQQRAIDNSGNVGAWSTAISVLVTVQVAISTASPLSPATVGASASGSFAATGGSGSGVWSKVSGDFPTGISMNSAGARSGTFSEEGTFTFRIGFVDAVGGGANNVEKDFTWVVNPPELISSYTPSTGLEAPELITFTEETIGTVTDQRISFGDYSELVQADDADFSHTYLAPGTYTFERWAKINGVPATETYEIVIGGDPPTPATGAIEFDEIELPRYYSDGASGGPVFSTGVLGNPQGVQQRNINRPFGIHEFELNFNGEDPYGELFEEFLDFFHTRQGMAIGFRFFPFVDNRWDDELIALTATDTAVYPLIRTYTKAGRTLIRRIVKPVPNLIVTIDGDPATDYSAYTIDYTTGIITFADEAELPVDGELRITGQYCIPVTFGEDKLNTTGYTSYADLNGLKVIELTPKALGLD